MSTPIFSLGQIVATAGCLEELSKNNQSPREFLQRHVSADWGSVCTEDAEANQAALQHGDRVMSVYPLRDGSNIWVITEWDRSATTLLLPSEY